ncbi:hypothetical protein QJ054_32815 [Streptomyces sp. AN-3]|uniref:hypothetical protein n=1 Tax=Streptomyces sp. AN-3 TaxID=3044177 RepID=UPI00249BD6A3|nr:hypothetical protein [Streptomyces sp. AN-3]MDI3101828.1 hypothetical protein [Streptomyces sp. AN-3]
MKHRPGQRQAKTELLHGDLCPLCRRPLTLHPTVEVRSNTPCRTRTDHLPYVQRRNHLMNDRYGL